MKMRTVLKKSLNVYRRNFVPLVLALLLQVVLRVMCLVPLMFLLSDDVSFLAWLCVPMYVLIALPARQNYALALQDMLAGGSVFSARLVSTEDYLKKLLRGVLGLVRIALWAVPVIAMTRVLYLAATEYDVLSMVRYVRELGDGDVVGGALKVVMCYGATVLVLVLGTAVHSGTRHAHALGNTGLLRGQRLKLTLLWFVGLLTLLPVLIFGVLLVKDYISDVVTALKNLQKFPSLSIGNGFAIAALIWLVPALPLKNLLPAVALHSVKEAAPAKETTDAAA